MEIAERLKKMSPQEICVLYSNAEALHETGILRQEAPLRKLTEEIHGKSTALHMTLTAFYIYRYIAVEAMEKYS